MTRLRGCVYFYLIALASAYGQESRKIFDLYPVYPMATVSETGADSIDFSFLGSVLRDKRIVLLGEQSHGDGATFDAKVRLIKYLHQKLGFEVVAFESGLYDNYRAFQEVAESNYQDSPLKNSIYYIWSETKEFESLLEYIHQNVNSSRPLVVAGFDCQEGDLFASDFLPNIKKLLGSSFVIDKNDLRLLDAVMTSGPEFIASSSEDSIKFFGIIHKMRDAVVKSKNQKNEKTYDLIIQTLDSWLACIIWEIDVLRDNKILVQNPRDLQMARNLIFLSSFYPDKKIIAWGASYHFANRIEEYQNSELTKLYSHKIDSMQKNNASTDIDKDLEGALPMGRILKDHFGSELYSLAFSSYDGSFGMLGTEATPLLPIQPPIASIEEVLVNKNFPLALVDYKDKRSDKLFYSSVLGNLPILAPWSHIFDGLFFIKTSYPPSLPSGTSTMNHFLNTQADEKNVVKNKHQEKRLLDASTGDGISYANIYLLNTSKGVATNANGNFVFNISNVDQGNQVMLSSIGYETDTITIGEMTQGSEFKLTPKSYLLSTLVVTAKGLSAKRIIKLAERRIGDNYYQLPHDQEFFYRVKDYIEDSTELNEEASIWVYNPVGYKSSTNPYRKLKGEILQFRNTTDNISKNIWAGVGSMWLMFDHDLVMDKDNVLHRPSYYDLTLNGTTIFENKQVYDIGFVCKRLGSYTTGFGYPSPSSASGKLFIDKDTYAVLKFEVIIHRKPFLSKRRPNIKIDPYGHQLIQTYKEFDGKYFLNYSKQVHYGNWIDLKTRVSSRHVSIREMLSTDIVTQSPLVLKTSISNIKSIKTIEDPEFWLHHNRFIEDNLVEYYKLLVPQN